ncbi:hypothetical protein [Erythrobacter dokdonensis]|uniref:Uncharacterized protein n=1 Tax=Erythrobacter dokdonensis DSW-74 TaxID=1300349 RepID=A0A1A7BHY7_9SPHN|nr:hypothetical protein [Erythrobacter dokdonensis]OBV11326.1 hypothetical protein I603_1734 [Erythrobacter dokdonensis DSW-74]
MITTFRSVLAALVALVLAAAAPALAQREVTDAADPYVHRAVGVAFPLAPADFRRGRVVEFNEEGGDAGVGYAPLGQPGEMTLYVYPGTGGECSDWFRDADDAILQRGNVTRRNFDSPIRFEGFAGLPQLSASYAVQAGAYGFDHPDLVSYLWVGCVADGDWIVKYRGSFPASEEAGAIGIAESLFAAIDWAPMLKRR